MVFTPNAGDADLHALTLERQYLLPANADKWVFRLAPFLAFVPAFLVWSIIPLGGDYSPAVKILVERAAETIQQDEAEKLADRILILADGAIIADGSADQLSRRMSTNAEVKWMRGGEQFVDAPTDATRFVRELFGQYGEVSSAQVVTDRETGRSRGFGFVEMRSGGAEAIQALHSEPSIPSPSTARSP